ncbi:MAG: ligand-binding sensor domain-containing protein [Aureispira sp.]
MLNPKYLLLFLSILSLSLFACHRSTNTTPINTPSIPPPELPSDNEYPPKDHLFFIEGQLCQHVRQIFQDQQGNIWLGTNVYGLLLYNGDSLKYLQEENSADWGRITGILEDMQGNIWFGTYRGLIKYDGQTFTNVTQKKNFLNMEIWCLHLDRYGKFWIGTTQGVYVFDGKKIQAFDLPKPAVNTPQAVYSETRITSIVEDKAGNLWFGTDGFGLCKYDGQSFTHFTTENGLSDNRIYQLFIDSRDNLWIGTFYGGLSRYNDGDFTNFTTDGTIEGVEVSGFFEDTDGAIWFAAENYGVYQYSKGVFTNFYKAEGLVTNGILSIYRDQEKRFWFGGWGGLFRYDNEKFIAVTKQGPWSP